MLISIKKNQHVKRGKLFRKRKLQLTQLSTVLSLLAFQEVNWEAPKEKKERKGKECGDHGNHSWIQREEEDNAFAQETKRSEERDEVLNFRCTKK